MGWNRRSPLFCTVDSARKTQTRVCSDKHSGLTVTIAADRGALIVTVRWDQCIDRPYFIVEFTPWDKSKHGGSFTLMDGVLDIDMFHEQLDMSCDSGDTKGKDKEAWRSLLHVNWEVINRLIDMRNRAYMEGSL